MLYRSPESVRAWRNYIAVTHYATSKNNACIDAAANYTVLSKLPHTIKKIKHKNTLARSADPGSDRAGHLWPCERKGEAHQAGLPGGVMGPNILLFPRYIVMVSFDLLLCQ